MVWKSQRLGLISLQGCMSDPRLNTCVNGFTYSCHLPNTTVMLTNHNCCAPHVSIMLTNQMLPKATVYTPLNNNIWNPSKTLNLWCGKMASFDPAATLDNLVRQRFRDMEVFWHLRDRKMLYLFYTIITLFNLIAECAVFRCCSWAIVNKRQIVSRGALIRY